MLPNRPTQSARNRCGILTLGPVHDSIRRACIGIMGKSDSGSNSVLQHWLHQYLIAGIGFAIVSITFRMDSSRSVVEALQGKLGVGRIRPILPATTRADYKGISNQLFCDSIQTTFSILLPFSYPGKKTDGGTRA